ncbi:hypothetical protein [Paractinoplanes maris]|uniref:hypothetical protein n=1 Tax=Paractinoplanes maris TaxID=1734446 RepID=UPI0020213E8F|nr:hypothetical protein [Actinoplanes maris]
MWLAVLVVAVAVVVVTGTRFYWARPTMTGVVQVRFPAGDTVPVHLAGRRAVKRRAGPGTVTVHGLREGTEPKMRVSWTDRGSQDSYVVSRGGSVTMRSIEFRHREL